MPTVSDLLKFEFIPDRIKEFVHSKYDVNSISIQVFGEVDNDYCLVMVAYDDQGDDLLRLFGSYKSVGDSIAKNIFEKFLEISNGSMLLPEGLEVFVEKFNQSQVLAILAP